ncbi:thiamine-monophosphate kinase [Salinisphaera sp. C84B14]|uniref:thiamine-phosphate kinase n=1 Tax=Salinisphaera sp. C84B14 TaxID=1304155 RepID=UPI003342470D
MREFALIERLAQRLGSGRADTRLGIGDDAALIAPPAGQELAITTDTLIAGRHFPFETPAFDIGYKALAVNLSDLAAMGADPAWVTIALSAPKLSADWCDALLDGALAAIGDHPVDIVGGDTTRGELSLTITAIGCLPAGRALRRSAARVGDLIAVTGTLGDAAFGLQCWPMRDRASDDQRFCIDRLARPQWRPGAALRGLANAAIDLSDGLAADLGHILAASGIGARLAIDALPASAALTRACDAESRRRLQWSGGDDYELCITLAEDRLDSARAALDCPLTVIGTIEQQPGLRAFDDNGQAWGRDGERGWDHFS